MRERVDLKSPVRENRPPGSVRGASGNRRPYRDSESKSKSEPVQLMRKNTAELSPKCVLRNNTP
jgi:hypothetical protein